MRTIRFAKLLATVGATALVVGLATNASAVSVEKARWQGTFDVTQTYKVHELNPEVEGTTEKRVHTVKSTCSGTNACAKARFTRVSGSGDKVAYSLKRTQPGTYEGSTSYETSWWRIINGDKAYTWTGH